ncbi:MAG: hypothetical protein Fur005_33520 [Roseiflexaceae bacterium]
MPHHQRWNSLASLATELAQRQEWMPLREAADLYRVTPETMQAWVRDQHFRSCRFQHALWVSRSDLEAGLRRKPAR